MGLGVFKGVQGRHLKMLILAIFGGPASTPLETPKPLYPLKANRANTHTDLDVIKRLELKKYK